MWQESLTPTLFFVLVEHRLLMNDKVDINLI